jgi:hypothetical protein
MSVLNKLATSLGRRDENPNIDLAKQLAAKNDKAGVKELIQNLPNKSKDIQHDCIKTLYETGAIKPALISPYAKEFMKLLDSKNNRMQWGAMTALSSIVNENPRELYRALPKIIDVADKGSVITKDHCYKIMCGICTDKILLPKMFPLMVEFLLKSPANQLPKYAEDTLPFINGKNKAIFLKTLNSRLKDIVTPTKKMRVEKVIKKLAK